MMLGAMISGVLSDRYGRKPIFVLFLVTNLVSGSLVAASPEIISYMILRLIVGASCYGFFLISYVTAIEMVNPQKRLLAGIGLELFFTLGYLLTAGFAYFITNWRILQIAITIPSLVFLLYWWCIPESVRWLLTKGRLEEAKGLLLKAALTNGVELSQDMLDSIMSSKDVESKPELEKPSVFDLLRYPNLRRKSLLLFFIRFVMTCTYLGLSWNTSNLAGNDYANFVICSLVEIPALLLVLFTLNKWGRRIILFYCMLLTGSSLILTALVPTDIPWLVVALTMIGKLAIASSLCTGHIITAEQYPTVIRNVGVGACSIWAMIGGMVAPAINHLSTYWTPLPSVVFGLGSLAAGLLAYLFLPETLSEKLPDSIQEGEQFGRKKSQLLQRSKLDREQCNHPTKMYENNE